MHITGWDRYGKISGFLNETESETRVAYRHHEYRFVPDKPNGRPANGHGVESVSGLNRQESALFDQLQDFFI